MTDLAIYDMDRTVTRTGTYTRFLLHCALHRAPWRLSLVPIAAGAMLAYVAGLVGRGRLKEINQALMLGRTIHPHQLEPLVESFAESQVATNLRPGAIKAIAADRADGRRIVMATASYRIYAEAIARRVGFDDVIATGTVSLVGDLIGARIDGENCYGPAKKRMVEQWLADNGLDRADVAMRFYSDHISDQPMFDWADEAVAVNPDAKLRALAQTRGWPVEDWG